MQTQAISNTKTNVNFKSSDKLNQASAFVNMDDEQLMDLACKNGYSRKTARTKNDNTLLATFLAIPIVDTISKGILAKGRLLGENEDVIVHVIEKSTPLSTKADAAIRTAGGWGVALGVVGIYSALKHAFTSKDDRQSANPAASFFLDLGIILLGCIGASMGIDKLKEKYPEKVEEYRNKYNKMLANLDKRDFNTKTLPEIEKFAAKHPNLAVTGKFALAYSIWITLGIGVYKMFNNAKENHNRIDRPFAQLKEAQLQTAKQLVGILSVQKDILSRGQEGIAADLDKAMSGQKPVSQKEIEEIKKNAKIYEKEKIKAKAWQDAQAKQAQEPQVIRDIEFIKIIEIPDKKTEE